MNALKADRIEKLVERVAAACFAAAVGYAVFSAFDTDSRRLVYSTGACAIAFLFCALAMKSVGGRSTRFNVRLFDPRNFDELGADELLLTERLHDELLLTDADRVGDELLLTDADRVRPAVEPLVLDDVLAAVGADSRVVRLFDRKAMPTPGQLGSSIDRHLARQPAHPDASQALSEALAELRRSLR